MNPIRCEIPFPTIYIVCWGKIYGSKIIGGGGGGRPEPPPPFIL